MRGMWWYVWRSRFDGSWHAGSPGRAILRSFDTWREAYDFAYNAARTQHVDAR